MWGCTDSQPALQTRCSKNQRRLAECPCSLPEQALDVRIRRADTLRPLLLCSLPPVGRQRRQRCCALVDAFGESQRESTARATVPTISRWRVALQRNWIGWDWIGADWIGLDRIGLGFGLNWIGLATTGFIWARQGLVLAARSPCPGCSSSVPLLQVAARKAAPTQTCCCPAG